MRRFTSSLFLLGLLSGTGGVAAVKNQLSALPLSFEENRGQAGPDVKFISRGPGYTAWLRSGEFAIAQTGSGRVLRLKLPGSNPGARLEALDRLPGITNYFIGNDSKKWRAGVPNYARIAVREAYPGIDFIFYGNEQQLEYDVVLSPGADAGRVRLLFEGADKLRKLPNGDLAVKTGATQIVQRKPVVFQDGSPIECGYSIHGKEVAFVLPRYNRKKQLVIDPSFVFSSYLGGTVSGSSGQGNGIAVDTNGNTYIVGTASSNLGWPVTNAEQATFGGGGSDAFVMKLNPQGSGFIYATYLGGPGYDTGLAIAADASGNAYVTGVAEAGFPGTPTLGPGAFHGGVDAFLAVLGPTGVLASTMYIGGPGNEQGNAIGVDSSGNAYIAGVTTGTLPVAGAAQSAFGGGNSDAFVAKVTPQGSFGFLTYLGGTGNDEATGIAVDASGAAYVTGDTTGSFPVANALQPNYGGGSNDAFVVKLSPAGAVLYSTYLGGSGKDLGKAIAIDAGGNAYVAGTTDGNFPVTNAFQSTYGGGFQDAFVAKVNSQGNALVYSTYLGGNFSDGASGIAVDSNGDALVTGTTDGAFPGTSGTTPGGGDAFVTMINPQGNGLVYSLYLGGSAQEYSNGIATDVNGTAYVTGETQSSNFPINVPAQSGRVFASSGVGFVSAIARGSSSAATLALQCTHGPGFVQNAVNVPFSLTVQNLPGSPATSGTVTVTDILPAGFTLVSINGTGWTCNGNSCSRTDSLAGNASYPPITVTVNVPANAPSQVTNQASAFGGGSTAIGCTDPTSVGTAQNTPTFGSFDTPTTNTTGIAGAIAVTGWALDPVGVNRVEIWRDSVPTDPANNGQIFIANAVFVTGARPDVQSLYPGYPNADRAGWGYLLLTNFLPNSDGSNGLGNGTYRLHAYAYSSSNVQTELSPPGKIISVDNTDAAKPFGTIDTPTQGGIVTGNQYINFGWALTPGAFFIPLDGSTISVFVDGVNLGHPVYNQFRRDIATLFASYSNSQGAVGFKVIDTTQYSNGTHVIGWLVSDNAGRSDGIGSRFFQVTNSSSNAPEDSTAIEKVTGVSVRRALNPGRRPQLLTRGREGSYRVDVEEMELFELHVGASAGSLRVAGASHPLPIGSTLKGGVFYWQVSPGFLGDYDLVFTQPDGSEVPVRVRIVPKTAGSANK